MPAVIDAVLARRPEGVILTGTVADPSLRQKLKASGATVIETRHMPTDPIDLVVGFSHHAVGEAVADALCSVSAIWFFRKH